MKLNQIKEVNTWNSGGGQELDVLMLQDGRVVCISEDAIVLYESQEDLEEGEAKQRPTIFL